MKFSKWYLVVLLLIGNIFLWSVVINEQKHGVMTVSFIDVGQGDAIFIEAPNGNQVLIDGGNVNRKVLTELGKLMPFYDKHIDVIVATHPDQDHIGGLVDVLNSYQTGLVIDSGAVNDTLAYKEKETLIVNKKIKRIRSHQSERLVLDEDIYLDLLFPDRTMGGVNPNDASIIARLSYKNDSFLFTGDSPEKIEKYLVTLYGDGLESDVLKAGHHGSDTSTNELFLSAVNPQFVVISSGKDNRYGHPHPDVLSLLEENKKTVLRTDELGTITFLTNGRNLSIK